MLENYVRTDLALELKEDISEKNDIAGVRVETYEDSEYGLTKTHIRVLDQTGAEILGKPIGNYITLESSKLCSEDENIHMPICTGAARCLKRIASWGRPYSGDWSWKPKYHAGCTWTKCCRSSLYHKTSTSGRCCETFYGNLCTLPWCYGADWN